MPRDGADLFEQRQVDRRLDVAHGARIAVPVPGAADVARGVDQTDTRPHRCRAAERRAAAPEAGTDDRDVDVVRHRRPAEAGVDERVGRQPVEARHLDVLIDPVRPDPPVALVVVAALISTGSNSIGPMSVRRSSLNCISNVRRVSASRRHPAPAPAPRRSARRRVCRPRAASVNTCVDSGARRCATGQPARHVAQLRVGSHGDQARLGRRDRVGRHGGRGPTARASPTLAPCGGRVRRWWSAASCW